MTEDAARALRRAIYPPIESEHDRPLEISSERARATVQRLWADGWFIVRDDWPYDVDPAVVASERYERALDSVPYGRLDGGEVMRGCKLHHLPTGWRVQSHGYPTFAENEAAAWHELRKAVCGHLSVREYARGLRDG